MSVFNINDYKEETNVDLEELDDRYVNTEGDTIDRLNIKSIQLYDTSTISFGDNSIQSTAFNQAALDTSINNVTTQLNTRLTATEIVANTANINANTANTNANMALSRTTGIFYYNVNDTTYIDNRLTISSPIDAVAGSAPQLTLLDNSTTDGNTLLSLMCGTNVGSWHSLVQNNDALFLLRKNDASQSYTGGMVFCTHGGNVGFRFSYNPDVPSVFRSNILMDTYNLTTTGTVSSGTCNCSGTITGNTINATTINLNGVNLNTTLSSMQNTISPLIGKSQVGRFFDSPLRGQGGGQPIQWYVSSPDLNSVNTAYHADILETGTNYITGKNYYLRFKTSGTYRLQMAWSITRNYVSTGQAMGWPNPPPYYPNPDFTLPSYGSGGNSGSTGATVAQFTGAVYAVKLTNSVNVTNVVAENFPKSIYNIIGQTFTGTDGITNSGVDTYVDHDPNKGQTYNFKGLNITNNIPNRPNRFYIDITFTINDGDPLDLYTHIQGSVPSNLSSAYYFNVNTHTYTITRLA